MDVSLSLTNKLRNKYVAVQFHAWAGKKLMSETMGPSGAGKEGCCPVVSPSIVINAPTPRHVGTVYITSSRFPLRTFRTNQAAQPPGIRSTRTKSVLQTLSMHHPRHVHPEPTDGAGLGVPLAGAGRTAQHLALARTREARSDPGPRGLTGPACPAPGWLPCAVSRSRSRPG